VSHVETGKVLHFEAQNRKILWPVVKAQVNGEIQPVRRRHQRDEKRPGALRIESMLVRLDSEDDEQREFLDLVRVPADTAHELGFIDRETCDRLVAEARTVTQREMRAAIEALPADDHYGVRGRNGQD
jgi:hypothetical protein